MLVAGEHTAQNLEGGRLTSNGSGQGTAEASEAEAEAEVDAGTGTAFETCSRGALLSRPRGAGARTRPKENVMDGGGNQKGRDELP